MNSTSTFEKQMAQHSVAIISLAIALIALFYTAWRNETTERNYNIRAASFEVLVNLGQLQIIVNHMHYDPENPLANPVLGWGHIALISDLSELLPEPVPSAARKLAEKWGKDWNKLKDNEDLTRDVSQAIDETRASILKILKDLY